MGTSLGSANDDGFIPSPPTPHSFWLVNYAEPHRAGLRVGTSITEGTANFLVNRRMNKSQQMQWSRRGADLLLQVRCATASSVPASYSCLTPIPAPNWLLLLDSQSLDGFPVIAPQGHRLADDDLEVALFVVPVPDVAAINADDDRLLPNLPLPLMDRTGAIFILDTLKVVFRQ